jgi:hypothetical protein
MRNRLAWISGVPATGVTVLALGLAVPSFAAAATGGAAPEPAASAPITVSSCTFSALAKALSQSTDVFLGCSGTIAFPGPVTVTKTVTISGSGHSVVFSGGHKHRLFLVSGSLTLVDVTLANASVTGANGVAGKKGAAGASGSAGKDGANGASASGEGGTGGNASPGQVGANGKDGRDGTVGQNGDDAEGGAIMIDAGATLIAAGDVFTGDTATGGNGGNEGVRRSSIVAFQVSGAER